MPVNSASMASKSETQAKMLSLSMRFIRMVIESLASR
jgi:hypothetical protein